MRAASPREGTHAVADGLPWLVQAGAANLRGHSASRLGTARLGVSRRIAGVSRRISRAYLGAFLVRICRTRTLRAREGSFRRNDPSPGRSYTPRKTRTQSVWTDSPMARMFSVGCVEKAEYRALPPSEVRRVFLIVIRSHRWPCIPISLGQAEVRSPIQCASHGCHKLCGAREGSRRWRSLIVELLDKRV